MTLGKSNRVKSRVSGVKPTGGLTPARPAAVASLGFVSPATKRPAEGIYVMQMHVRIGWWWQLGLGWPELSPAMTLAVAGVRTRSAPMLGGTARRVRSATGSCECGGDDDVLRIDPTWLWPRRRCAVAAVGAAELGGGA